MSEPYKVIYKSDSEGKGGQHTNGPDYGVIRVEHEPTMVAVEVHTYTARGAHRARDLATMLCEMAVAEIAKPPLGTFPA